MTDTGRPGKGFSARRSVVIRDFVIFALKVAIDGLKDLALIQIASIAVLADLLRGEGKPRLFYSVVQLSERFDLWLNINGAVDELERGETEDGLFGASRAGSDTLLGKLEGMVRGNDYDGPPDSESDGPSSDQASESDSDPGPPASR